MLKSETKDIANTMDPIIRRVHKIKTSLLFRQGSAGTMDIPTKNPANSPPVLEKLSTLLLNIIIINNKTLYDYF